MTARDHRRTGGMSEIAAELLIIVLVLVIAAIAYAAFSGALNPLFFKKSAYIAGTAAVTGIPQTVGGTDDVLTFLPKAGDAFYLTGQTYNTSGAQVTLKALSPDGKILTPDASSLKGPLYGRTLFIYPSTSGSATQCDYTVSDQKPTGSLRAMVVGCWTIQLTDENVHVIAGTYKSSVTRGTASVPSAGGFISASGKFYRSDCTLLNQTPHGTLTTSNTGPGNMTVTHFNGNSYLTIANDPTLAFTSGNLSLSLWFKPTTATTPASDGSNWHQLLGKGTTTGVNNENDNYQLFQYGNQILFEWNDATTGQHYQAYTTASSGTVSSTNWNYVTVSVTNGNLALYVNGVSQALTYDNSNVPGTNILSSAKTVNLQVNNNDVTVGKQNAASSSDYFYYSGDMGAVSLYNRGLTQAEVATNYAEYHA